MVAPDIGGGFGPKLCVYSEDIAVVAAAKLMRRPIKWIEDRREHFTNAAQERDQYWSVEIAVAADGKSAGHSRQPRPRRRRLCAAGRQHPVQFGLDDERALYRALAQHGRGGRRDQQDAGVLDPWRRLSAGRLRDGADDGPRRARVEDRARRAAAAQPHSRGEDALHQAAQGPFRRRHAVRLGRLSRLPGDGAQGRRLGRFPAAAGARRANVAATSASGSRTASRAPAAARSSPAWCACRTPARDRLHRRRRARTGLADRAGADRRERARAARGGHQGGGRRHLGRRARARRLRQPPDGDRRQFGAARRARGRRQGEEARQPHPRGRRARSRIAGRRSARRRAPTGR